jgi:hypothetical protein
MTTQKPTPEVMSLQIGKFGVLVNGELYDVPPGMPFCPLTIPANDEPEFCEWAIHHFSRNPETGPDTLRILTPDGAAGVSNEAESVEFRLPRFDIFTTFIPNANLTAFAIGASGEVRSIPDTPEARTLFEALFERNKSNGFPTPDFRTAPKTRRKLPKSIPHATFPEAKAGALAISDGRDRRDWRTVEGALALLHSPKRAAHQVRFEPNNILADWWGKSPASAEILWEELQKMDMDSVMLYHVTLANILFDPKARFTASIDDLIKAIGREGEAKRSAASRADWRRKVWRALLLFDSLAIIGARSGTWREPGSAGQKRDKMAPEKLISRDALFRIIGTRETQGSFDNSEPPKEVSLVPGEWLMQFHGNREILSEFGDVLKIAAIPRGKAAGNWAACAGLMLNQLWRERAAKAARKRAGKGETLDFGTFTRRQLLERTLRSDHDISAMLQDSKNAGRCRDYWKAAIKQLKSAGIIGHYSEGEESAHEDWRERWLDQPLDIRPKTAMPQALKINADAAKARARTPRKKAPKLEMSPEK